MKIDKPGKLITPNPPDVAARAPGKSAPPAAPARQHDATSVSLGSTAAQLRSLEGDLANTPTVNAAKVAEIKQAISDGRFKINANVVADRLLETVRDLIGNRPDALGGNQGHN